MIWKLNFQPVFIFRASQRTEGKSRTDCALLKAAKLRAELELRIELKIHTSSVQSYWVSWADQPLCSVMYKIEADRICVDLNFNLLFFRKRLKCVYCATKIVPLFTNWEKQSEKKASSFVKIEVGATKISAYASIFVAPTSILSKLSAFFSDCFSQFVNKGTIINVQIF